MAVTVSPLAQALFARAASADGPVFTPGQLLEALVLGKLPDGMMALRIGDITVSAQLPPNIAAGTTLQLQVTSGGPTPQLAIVGQPTPPVPAQPMPVPAPMAPLVDLPVIVQPPAVQAQPVQAMPAAPVPSAPAQIAQPAMPPTPILESPPPLTTAGARTESTPPPPVAGQGNSTPQPTATAPAPVQLQTPVPVAPSQSAPTPASPTTSPSVATTSILASNTPPAAPPAPPSVAAPPVVAIAPPPSAPATMPTVPPLATAAPASPVAPPPPAALAQAPAIPPTPPASTAPVALAVPSTPAPAPLPTAAPIVAPLAPASSVQAVPTIAVAPTVPVTAVDIDTGSPLLVAQGAARPAASMADLPRVALPATPTPVATTPAAPATPQAALAQMVPEALAKQNSLGPLLLSLASLATKSTAMPEPLLRAALQVLAQRVAMPPNGPTAELLKAAIAKSGVYLEAGLARGAPPAGDMKAAVTGLRAALTTFLGGNPAPVQAAQQAAPPLRGLVPRAEPLEPQPPPPVAHEAGRALHSQADAALSRIKLMQFASLPDADPTRPVTPELRLELPFLIGSELVMAQFQVFRDGARKRAEQKRGWTMRFAMNFAASGEVGAEIGLLGRSVNVALWAAERETAERLNAALPELAPALARLGLDAGAIRVRNLPPEAGKPASGQFVDAVS